MTRLADWAPGAARTAAPPDLVVRPAAPDDCPALASLEASVFEQDPAEVLARCHAQAGDPDRLLLVAVTGVAVVGFARAVFVRPPADAPPRFIPAGWYLVGVAVSPAFRRAGVGRALTAARLTWIAARAPEAWYFTNARNRVSLALHAALGFEEVTRDFVAPNATFDGGVGVLSRLQFAAPGAEPPT